MVVSEGADRFGIVQHVVDGANDTFIIDEKRLKAVSNTVWVCWKAMV